MNIYRVIWVVWLLCVTAVLCLFGWADNQLDHIESVERVQPQIEKIHEHINKMPEDVIEETEDYIIEEVEREMTHMSYSVPQPTEEVTPTPTPTQQTKSQKPLPTTAITASLGRVRGPQEEETYYNLPMDGVVQKMRNHGYAECDYPYYVRDDGVKMLGDFIMVATDFVKYPRGTVVQTSLGQGLVCDKCEPPDTIDIAVSW